ncbi:MAG: polyprenyl synthetase family protein [Desulfovibrio sp.]|nr:polyprenyl synthetase family protein [Desulfovibrio sp.]
MYVTNALEPLFSKRRSLVERFLEDNVGNNLSSQTLSQSMRYSLLAGGKRLRPVLCLTCAALFGKREEDILPFACAIEMIHTYSLIHDDLPCMDDDDLRRGRPSNHKAFSEATALLAGDALLTDAFFWMTHAKADSKTLCSALCDIAQASGSRGMAGGQALDMDYTARSDVTVAMLADLHALKTGALIRASCTTGARLAECDQAGLAAMTAFGTELGIAFQIVDDILDETADPKTLGKPVHSDRDNQKATYPSLLGLEESQRLAKQHAEKAMASLAGYTGPDARFLQALACYTVERVC